MCVCVCVQIDRCFLPAPIVELAECAELETMSSMVADDFLELNPIGPAYDEAAKRKEAMHWKLMAMREIILTCDNLKSLTRPIVPPSTSALMQGTESDAE